MSNVTVQTYTTEDGEKYKIRQNAVSPGFFRTMDVPLLAVREFKASDIQSAPQVAVIWISASRPNRCTLPLSRRSSTKARESFPEAEQATNISWIVVQIDRNLPVDKLETLQTALDNSVTTGVVAMQCPGALRRWESG